MDCYPYLFDTSVDEKQVKETCITLSNHLFMFGLLVITSGVVIGFRFLKSRYVTQQGLQTFASCWLVIRASGSFQVNKSRDKCDIRQEFYGHRMAS